MFDVVVQAYKERLEEVGKSYVLEIIFMCFSFTYKQGVQNFKK